MVRYRKIRKYDNGWVIRLLQQDISDLNLEDGQEVDIDDLAPKTKNEVKK